MLSWAHVGKLADDLRVAAHEVFHCLRKHYVFC